MPPADRGITRAKQLKKKAKKKSPIPKAKAPTPRQIRNARSQSQSYVSLGKAVEKDANRQKRKAKVKRKAAKRYLTQDPIKGMRRSERRAVSAFSELRQADPKKYDSDVKRYMHRRKGASKLLHDFVRTASGQSQKGDRGGVKGLGGATATAGGSLAGLQHHKGRGRAAANLNPVLEQLTRPNHAIMGAARQEVKNIKKRGLLHELLTLKPQKKNIREAIKGAKNETKYTGSDVLKEAGVKSKTLRTVGGLALDFTTDPTVGAKVTRLAPKTALEREAARATADAARAGKTRKLKGVKIGKNAEGKVRLKKTTKGVTVKRANPGRAKHHAGRAARLREKAETASTSRGIQVGYDAKVPFGPRVKARTSGKTSAKVGKRVAPAGEAVRHSVPVRMGSALFNSTARKGGESIEEGEKFLYAERKKRARGHEDAKVVTRRGTAHGRAVHRGPSRKSKRAARKAGTQRPERRVDVPNMIAGIEHAAREPLLDTKLIRKSRKRRVSKSNPLVRVDAKTNVPYDEWKKTAPIHTVEALPPRAKAVAEATRAELGAIGAESRAAKLLSGDRGQGTTYYTHRTVPGKRRGVRRKGRPGVSPYANERLDARPISEHNAERIAKGHDPTFSEDHPTVMAEYRDKMGKAITNQKSVKDFIGAGTPLTRSSFKKMDPETHELYHVTDGKIAPLTGKHGKSLSGPEVKSILAKAEKKGESSGVTILPIERADDFMAGARNSGHTTKTKWALNKANKPIATFKTFATVLNAPFYQIRNIVDDSYRAWTGDTQLSAFPKAASLVKDMALHERRQTGKLSPEKIGGTVEIAGKDVNRHEFVQQMIEDGAARTGPASSDEMLEGSMKPAVGRHRFQPVTKVRQWSQNLEDSPRVAAYIGALDRGMTRQEAAAHTRAYMFDYDELTDTERAVRALLIPFYTYAKNNTLLHARLLVSRPGKPAAIQKLRESVNEHGAESDKYKAQVKSLMPILREAQKEGLLDADDVKALKAGDFSRLLSQTDQRGFPFMGPDGKITYMPLGLTDLNRIPLATSYETLATLPKTQWDLAMSMVGPQKLPLEMMQNYSFFFKQAIYRDENNKFAEKWTAAPAWAARAGLTKQRTIDGKTLPAWTTKTDYMVRSFGPQAGLLANVGNPVKNARGQTTKSIIRKQLTGVRSGEVDDRILNGIMEHAIKESQKVDVEIQNRGDIPKDKGRTSDGVYPTMTYYQLGQRKKSLTALIDHIKKERGTYVPPKTTLRAPPLTPQQEIQKKLKDLKTRDPRKEIQDKLKVMRAKQEYLRKNHP